MYPAYSYPNHMESNMPSNPQYSVWSSHPHPWRTLVGVPYSGLNRASGSNHLIRSEGHYHKNLRASGPDSGGDFEVHRHDYSEKNNYALFADGKDINSYPIILGDFGTEYQGNLFAINEQSVPGSHQWDWNGNNQFNPSSDLQLQNLGTSYIAKVLPTNPVADLATFVGEAREGLPRLAIDSFRSRAGRARSAGSDYLNYEFGWKPFVNDLKKFSKAVTQHDKIMRQYERNSGKAVKRKRTFTDSVHTEVFVYPGFKPKPEMYFWLSVNVVPGTLTATVTNRVRRWFSGSFTYYLEPDNGKRDLWSQRANKLYGTRLTPETVWNLAPWSWAADWVGNYGDVLHNLSAFANDGLVMPYAYVMEQCSVEVRYNLDGVFLPTVVGQSPGPYSFEQVFTSTVKKRLKATPYGFGLNPDVDFTLRQKAIIASLGLTKGRKKRR